MALATPLWLQNNTSYSARGDRLAMLGLVAENAGVVDADSMRVTASGPASMTLQISSGTAIVPGNKISQQGMYSVSNIGPASVTVPASGSTARIDAIILRVNDSEVAGSVNNAVFEVVGGTPSATPVAPNIPEMSTLLATVRVNPGVSPLTGTNIDLTTRHRATYRRQMGGNVITVENIAERTTLGKRLSVSPQNPLIVYRTDATAGQELEYSTNGTTFEAIVPVQQTGTIAPLVGWGEYYAGHNKWSKTGNVVTVQLATRRTDVTFGRGAWEYADFTNAVASPIRPSPLGRGPGLITTFDGPMELAILTSGRFAVRKPEVPTSFPRNSFWIIGNVSYLV